MQNKKLFTLFSFAFLVFLFFNSPKCVEYERFNNQVELEEYLKKNFNHFYDIKITESNKFKHIYSLRKESFSILKKCKL